MESNNVLIASLLAQKVNIPRGGAVQNELSKHVYPKISLRPLDQQAVALQKGSKGEVSTHYWQDASQSTKQFFPLRFLMEGELGWFDFPFEPMISIQGKNNIVKRNVSKGTIRGSVKERWNQEDYSITIEAFIQDNDMRQYPKDTMQQLARYLVRGKVIRVECEPLQLLNINYIVIEDFSLPFTKGENVQRLSITALSDDVFELLVLKDKPLGYV